MSQYGSHCDHTTHAVSNQVKGEIWVFFLVNKSSKIYLICQADINLDNQRVVHEIINVVVNIFCGNGQKYHIQHEWKLKSVS